MGGFMDSLDCLKPSSLPFTEIDPSLDLMSQLAELSGSVMDNAATLALMSCHSNLNCFTDFSMPLFAGADTLPMAAQPPCSAGEQSSGERKRKMIAAPDTTTSTSNSCIPSETGFTKVKAKKENSSGKRGRSSNSKEDEKLKEVVHVRARRGQATDSHSLAERVRREKINERMRCLQDLVPGCYKTMGMAGMLDEIINYVQSLQNQVDFLSMKLSTASSFYDYSLEETPHQASNAAYEQADRLFIQEYGGGGSTSSFCSQMPF